MKKISFAALAATIMLAGCSKDNNNEVAGEDVQLTVKISGVVKSRTVEAPGETAIGTIQLRDGHIFVIDRSTGSVVHQEPLSVSDATSNNGQVLTEKVSPRSSVYILGNIPSDDQTVRGLTTLSAIQSASAAMTTQTDYKTATLSNADGNSQDIEVEGATAKVEISLNPVISRLELVKIEGASNDTYKVTTFDVTGVFIDDYYPSFTYSGGHSGDMFEQRQSTTFTGIGDQPGPWAGEGEPSVAAPADGNVWAYNVAAQALPRLIVRLQNVKYLYVGWGEIDMGSNEYFITVTGYKDLSAFERGKIYRIGTESNPFVFDPDDLYDTPNPDVTLTVHVEVVEWQIETPDAEF